MCEGDFGDRKCHRTSQAENLVGGWQVISQGFVYNNQSKIKLINISITSLDYKAMLPFHKSTLNLNISRIISNIDFDIFKGSTFQMMFVHKSIYLLPCFLGTPTKIKTNVYAAPA